jgi:hypothetical protein
LQDPASRVPTRVPKRWGHCPFDLGAYLVRAPVGPACGTQG